ncbi:MAG: hypothetical protein ACFB2Z_12465 [Maricaulaceae bacterium]
MLMRLAALTAYVAICSGGPAWAQEASQDLEIRITPRPQSAEEALETYLDEGAYDAERDLVLSIDAASDAYLRDDLSAASSVLQKAVRRAERANAPPEVLAQLYDGLGNIEFRRGKVRRALSTRKKAVSEAKQAFGAGDIRVVALQANLAQVYLLNSLERLGSAYQFEALQNVKEALKDARKRYGDAHSTTVAAAVNKATVDYAFGRRDDAFELLNSFLSNPDVSGQDKALVLVGLARLEQRDDNVDAGNDIFEQIINLNFESDSVIPLSALNAEEVIDEPSRGRGKVTNDASAIVGVDTSGDIAGATGAFALSPDRRVFASQLAGKSVDMQYCVGPDGRAFDIGPVSVDAPEKLVENARAALEKRRFYPVTIEGQRPACSKEITRFTVEAETVRNIHSRIRVKSDNSYLATDSVATGDGVVSRFWQDGSAG